MRRAALALSTALIAAPALTLGAAQAQDRYGPQAGVSLTPVSYASDQPLLNWPGKRPAPTDEAPSQPQAAPPAPPASIYTPPPEPAPPPVRETPPLPVVQAAPAPVSVYTPPQPPAPKPPVATASLDMRPLLPASPPKPVHVAATPAPTAQVVHATAPKPPKPAPTPPVKVAAAAAQSPAEPDAPHKPWSATGAGGVPAHFYSTVREFGLKPDPDPAPLPAQFFADQSGGDLAAPPPPLQPHPVPGSQTVDSTATANTASNRARAIALDTPSPDGSDN
jgi:hypothetical protein